LCAVGLKPCHLSCFPSSASVCGAAVASPGHPEPCEPPVSAGPDIRSPSVCSAQMAAVHPVQDGSGGNPVIWGRLAVLSHVTCSAVALGPVWVLRPACILSGRTLWPKKGLLCKLMLWDSFGLDHVQHLSCDTCICTVNLCYFKVLSLELIIKSLAGLWEIIASGAWLLRSTDLKNFYRPMLVLWGCKSKCLLNLIYAHSVTFIFYHFLSCLVASGIIKVRSFLNIETTLSFHIKCRILQNSNVTFYCPLIGWCGKCPVYHNADGTATQSALLFFLQDEKLNLRCIRENNMTFITQLPSEILVRLSVMLPLAIRALINQRPIGVAAAAS